MIVSDVAALTEIVQDGLTGLHHQKDDAESLAQALEQLIANPERRRQLGDAARVWTEQERDWRVLAGRLGGIYEELLASHNPPQRGG